MKDGIIKGLGNSRLLRGHSSIPSTYDDFRAAWIAGTILADLLYNAAGWDVEGTPFNKASLLTDTIATTLGLTSDDPTVNEALQALYSIATQLATSSVPGRMSASDFAKLAGIAVNANNYVHPATSGNKHVPTGGAADYILGWGGDGIASWIQQLAEKSLLGATVQGYFGGLTTVEAALKNCVHKDTIVTLSSGTSWTPPRANMLIDIWMIGGGGGGAGSANASYGAGGGGGGYVKFIKDYLITSASAIAYVIGSGGAGGAAGSAGSNGGDTSFGTIKAFGGKGAPAGNTGGAGGAGGAGGGSGYATGGAGASGIGGDGLSGGGYSGGLGEQYEGRGGYCILNSTLYGGGGGGANGGAGGAGGGGTGGASGAVGGNATLYGAGGGGGSLNTGGNGYQGVIIIGYNS